MGIYAFFVGCIMFASGVIALIVLANKPKAQLYMQILVVSALTILAVLGLVVSYWGAEIEKNKVRISLAKKEAKYHHDFGALNGEVEFNESVLILGVSESETADVFDLFYKGKLRTIMKIEGKSGYFYEVPRSNVRPTDKWEKVNGHYIIKVDLSLVKKNE